jgi:hypothetical protein
MELFNDFIKIKKIQLLFLVVIMYVIYQYIAYTPIIPFINYTESTGLDSIYIALPQGWSIPASDTAYYPNYILK